MIKGVLFDKDGTIIDFFSVWPVMAREVIPKFLKQNEIRDSRGIIMEEMFASIGLIGEKVDPKGSFAYKSYGEVAEDLCAVLTDHGILLDVYSIYAQIKNLFKATINNTNQILKTFTDMPELMKQLKKQDLAIGLATSDIQESAEKCLKELHIINDFVFIGADDGVRKLKPNAEMIDEFRAIVGIERKEIAVVGDTFNDMLFAKQNGAIAIGVLSGVSAEEDFDGFADYIIESIADLPELIEKIKSQD